MVRCKGVLNKDKTQINFFSRTGKDYNPAMTHFVNDKNLIAFMKKHNCEIDGEIYRHGLPLNEISGHARKERYEPDRHDQLNYYVFDCPIEEVSAETRFEWLGELQETNLNERIIVVEHHEVNTYNKIMDLHDKYVEEGYEGAMVQLKNSKYEFGKRSSSMWKIKLFQDDEFVITGKKDGLRDEDFVFTLVTKDGNSFEAKPIGDRKLKQWYRDNIETLKGKLGTVKFFNYGVNNVPVLTTFKCVRNE